MGERGLNIGIIGVGQAGGNIADEFAKINYKAIAINTSSTDLNALEHINKNHQLLINTGIQGAGSDPEIGREVLENRISEVYDLVEKVFDNTDKLFVVGGLGGGTASGMDPELTQILIEEGYNIGGITTLPLNVEAPRKHMVALSAFDELSTIEGITTLFVVDNQKASTCLPKTGIRSRYKIINENIVRLIDTVNKMSTMPSRLAFDPRDLEVTMNNRGCAFINQVTIENIDDLKDEITLSKLLQESLKQGIFADTDFKKAQAAAVLFELPTGAEYYLNDGSIEKMKRELGNPFDFFPGIYENPNKKKMGTLTVLITGLPFPENRLIDIQNTLEEGENEYSQRRSENQSHKFQSKSSHFMEKFGNKKGQKSKKQGPSTLERLIEKKNMKNQNIKDQSKNEG